MEFLGNLYANTPIDWLILTGIAVLAALDCLKNGAQRTCIVALAFPVSTFLASTILEAEILGGILSGIEGPYRDPILFAILFAIAYILIGRFDFAWGDDSRQVVQAALCGGVAAAIVATFWTAAPALHTLWSFGSHIEAIFGANYQFWWILASYGILSFVRNS